MLNIFKFNKDYKVGLYLRLSKEDGDKSESESITNQRNILERFCRENDLKSYKEFVDDGYSGINFNRPAFIKLKNEIEEGKINMVVVKDLSRLGRDYSEVGKYIERYFPEHNIRFIAIYDEVDTITETDDMLPLKAVLNDLYCKDASRKFRAMIYNKKKDGLYLCTEAPFGYKKDINKKCHLVINEEESKVVKSIFKMYLDGLGTYQISQKLNNEKVPVPSTNRKNCTSITKKWYAETVRRILRKEVYVGDTVLGTTKKINYKSKKIINLPPEEWIITRDTHEAIISRKDFEIVQKRLNENKSTKINKYEYLLKGIVRCNDCGCAIAWITKKDKYKDKVTVRRYGVCPTAEKKVGMKKCTKKYYNYDLMEKRIISEIQKVINIYLNNIDLGRITKKSQEILNNKIEIYKKKIEKLQLEVENYNKKIDTTYIDKLDNVISNEDYDRISRLLISKRENIKEILKDVKNEYQKIYIDNSSKLDDKKLKECLNNFNSSNIITRENLDRIIDKIYVDKEKNIEIIFNFKELNVINETI